VQFRAIYGGAYLPSQCSPVDFDLRCGQSTTSSFCQASLHRASAQVSARMGEGDLLLPVRMPGTHRVMICVIRRLALTIAGVCLKLGCFQSTSTYRALEVSHITRYIDLPLTYMYVKTSAWREERFKKCCRRRLRRGFACGDRSLADHWWLPRSCSGISDADIKHIRDTSHRRWTP